MNGGTSCNPSAAVSTRSAGRSARSSTAGWCCQTSRAREIVQVATDIGIVRREEHDIRLDYGEHFFLLVQLQGVCGVEQQGRQSIISAGDCILVDSSLPSSFYFNGQFSNHLSVHLPRQLLLSEKPE